MSCLGTMLRALAAERWSRVADHRALRVDAYPEMHCGDQRLEARGDHLFGITATNLLSYPKEKT